MSKVAGLQLTRRNSSAACFWSSVIEYSGRERALSLPMLPSV